jgi:ligand-binding SRPBCC domain-containing protein
MFAGAEIDYALRLYGMPIRWKTRIATWNPPHDFVDLQLRGPYSLWEHTHRFIAEGNQTRMFDVVRYALPLGPLGTLAHGLWVGNDLRKIFDFRARRVAEMLKKTEPSRT